MSICMGSINVVKVGDTAFPDARALHGSCASHYEVCCSDGARLLKVRNGWEKLGT